MQNALILGLTAIAALIPATILSWRPGFTRNGVLWSVLAVAIAGPSAVLTQRAHGVWQADFATTIWVSVAVTMFVFLIAAVFLKSAWRLTPLLSVYMIVFGVMGVAWQNVPTEPMPAAGVSLWLMLHIVLAVTTYALATLAAVAAWAAFMHERALKNKQRPLLDGVLPSITDSDRLVMTFLALGEGVLGLGLISGIAVNLVLGHTPLPIDHKTVFTLAAFVIIGVLLIAQAKYGLRGRRFGRGVLLAYLLLTLGYPGVKFVSDVLLG